MTPTTHTPFQRWCRFWMAPADPTTLGFMRVVTGLLILYIHGVYSLDLQAFFGKYGWYGLADVNRERFEAPNHLTPLWGKDAWQDFVPSATVPIYPHRRLAVMTFFKALAVNPADRKKQLAYLVRLQNLALVPEGAAVPGDTLLPAQEQAEYRTDKLQAGVEGLRYLMQLYTAEKDRKPQLDAMVNKDLRSAKDLVTVPAFLDAMPDAGPNSRASVRTEIEALLAVLPPDSTQRKYILDHFSESRFLSRQALLQFLIDLPDDAAARAQRLDFLEYWNSEERKAFRTGNSTFSLWFHIHEPTEMALTHGVILVIMAMFTIGLFTRVTSVLTWLAAISYIHRTQQVLFGMDTMMNILLIYLMIGNSGAALSVDRWLAKYRAARRSLARTGTIDAATQAFLAVPPPSRSVGLALRLTQVHYCIIYMAAGMSKLKGEAWWSTNAFWDTLANPEFTLIHFQWYESLLRWMMQERLIYATAAGGGVLFTLFMELGLPFIVWTRLRPYILMGAVILHFGIAVFMGLNLFGLLMLAMLLAFIPGEAIRTLLRGNRRGTPVSIQWDQNDNVQANAAAIAVASDTDGQVTLIPTTGAYTVIVGPKSSTGRDAARTLFGSLSLLRTVAWFRYLPGVTRRLSGSK